MRIPDDPQAWSQGAAAFKSIFDGLRAAIAMVRDLRGTPAASGKEARSDRRRARRGLTKPRAIAEAEVAQALGFELCKCEFPPVAMLTVGSYAVGSGKRGPVYECPKCKFNTAAEVKPVLRDRNSDAFLSICGASTASRGPVARGSREQGRKP